MPSIYISASTQLDNVGVLNYGTEAAQMTVLADKVAALLAPYMTVYRNSVTMGLWGTINDSNAKGADMHFAIHSNAGGGVGTEIYYFPGTPEGERMATLAYNRVAPLTISNDRGVKTNSSFAELRATNMPAVLIEIMFHDNATDVVDYLAKIDQIALALANSILEYFGMVIIGAKKDWLTILKEVSSFWLVWQKFIEAHPEVNLKGLIEKLGNR